MKVYVCGPMTYIPQFNYPAFDAAAERLRELGHDVTSPAEMDSADTRAAALASTDGAPGTGSSTGETWGDFLSRDVKLLADGGLDTIVVLPGWERSRGALLETFCGHQLCELDVLYEDSLTPVPLERLVSAWSRTGEFWCPVPRATRPELINAA